MRVIRLKTDKNQIVAFGYTNEGGLGKFDPNLFEEVELEALPENWVQYKEPPEARPETLKAAIVEVLKDLTEEDQDALFTHPLVLKTAVKIYVKEETLTITEYEKIRAELVQAALESGFEAADVTPLAEKVDEKFKDKVKFKDN